MAHSTRESIISKLQSILDQSVASGVPGISATIHTEKAQWNLTAGYSAIPTRTPISKDATFGIGSITKVFIAVVILQLVQEGKLSLEDQAISVLGVAMLEGIPHAKEACIKDLLSHTGGIPSWEDDSAWIRDGRGENIQPGRIWAKQDTLEYVRRPDSPAFTVGKYHYANTNYTILGLIIERITQKTAESEVRRRILDPLDISNTYFEGFEQPLRDQTPSRYHWATETFRRTAGISSKVSQVNNHLIDVTGTNLSVSWTAGGMISTPSNLVKLALALQTGRLLQPDSLAVLMDWHEADESKDMGHGIFRLKDTDIPGTWVGHNGGVLGFTAALWWDTTGSAVVSILSNVGASHAGNVPSSAAYVALKTNFLQLVAQLATI